MNELLKILSKIFEEENGDKLKNLTELYSLCMSKGYEGDMATFESEYKKLVEQYSDMLKTSEMSDFDLESISGGVNNTFKSSVAMLMTALSLSGSASSMVSAATNNSINQHSVTQKASDWIKSKYNTVSEKTTEWLKARSKNEITAMKAIGGAVGLGLVSAPVIALATKNSNNYKNVQTLVFLLTNSESYINTSDSKKLSLIKKACSELGLQINKQDEIGTDIQTVKSNLISMINKKIESLYKSDKNHKDIKILMNFLERMQSTQGNIQKENSEHVQCDGKSESDKEILNEAKKLVKEVRYKIEQNNYTDSKNKQIKSRAAIIEDCLDWLDNTIEEILSRNVRNIEDARKLYTLVTNIEKLTNNINDVAQQDIKVVAISNDRLKEEYMENEEFWEKDDEDDRE